MNRPRAYTIAAILMVVYSLIGALDSFSTLSAGAAVAAANAESGPPYALAVVSFIASILGFVSAYGVWRVQKWGVILTLVLSALNILTSLPAVMFAPDMGLRVVGAMGVIWAGVIIVLLLRPAGKPVTV